MMITIRGTNALLLHKYTVSTVAKGPGIRGMKEDYSREWEKGTYLNKEGQVIMPWQNIMASLFDGCKGEKNGKIFLTRIVHTSLLILTPEPLILIDGKPITLRRIEDEDWIYTSGAVVSGRRVDRSRAMLPSGWTISFEILIKDKLFDEDMVLEIVQKAGTKAGLGDWRPSAPKKPGPYGTYEVER